MKERGSLALSTQRILLFAPSGSGRELSTSFNAPPHGAHSTCSSTISVSCATVLTADSAVAKEKAEFIPEDGWILTETEVAFTEGEMASDALQRACREKKIPVDIEKSPAYGAYIKGINNIYQGDCGEYSYWTYTVNGEFLDIGCGLYEVQDGDVICMLYTCNMGADVGLEGMTM